MFKSPVDNDLVNAIYDEVVLALDMERFDALKQQIVFGSEYYHAIEAIQDFLYDEFMDELIPQDFLAISVSSLIQNIVELKSQLTVCLDDEVMAENHYHSGFFSPHEQTPDTPLIINVLHLQIMLSALRLCKVGYLAQESPAMVWACRVMFNLELPVYYSAVESPTPEELATLELMTLDEEATANILSRVDSLLASMQDSLPELSVLLQRLAEKYKMMHVVQDINQGELNQEDLNQEQSIAKIPSGFS